MSQMTNTIQPPYYAVIFTSLLSSNDEGYEKMAQRMFELANQQQGFLGIDSARQGIGITVSYWQNVDAIKRWKQQSEHQVAQQFGKQKWYDWYSVKIAKVESQYEFGQKKT